MKIMLSRKVTFIGLLGTVLALAAVFSMLAAGAFAQGGASPAAAGGDVSVSVDGVPVPAEDLEPGGAVAVNLISTSDLFTYSTKVVCVPELGQAYPALIHGLYKTAVNVHNPWSEAAAITKWVTLSPPQGQLPITGDIINEMLHPWYAFDINCPHLKHDFGLPQNAKTTGGKGFLVIQSDRTLDMAAIYTQLAKRANGVGSSMEVEYVEPRCPSSPMDRT